MKSKVINLLTTHFDLLEDAGYGMYNFDLGVVNDELGHIIVQIYPDEGRVYVLSYKPDENDCWEDNGLGWWGELSVEQQSNIYDLLKHAIDLNILNK